MARVWRSGVPCPVMVDDLGSVDSHVRNSQYCGQFLASEVLIELLPETERHFGVLHEGG